MKSLTPLLLCCLTVITDASEWQMTPQQVVEALKGKDSQARYLAEGYLYLMPSSAFPIFMEEHARRPDQHVPPWGKVITLAMLLRGYEPAIAGYLSNRYGTGRSQVAYSLDDTLILRNGTREELQVLAQAYAKHLTKALEKTNYSFQGDELWIRIAGITGNEGLMRHVITLATSPQGRIARSRMAGLFDADLCGEYLLPIMLKGEIQERQEIIRMLRPGWEKGPSKAMATLMNDENRSIRQAIYLSLTNSSSEAALTYILAGLQDSDRMIVSTCMDALAKFKGESSGQLLKRIAVDEKLDWPMRERAWYHLMYNKKIDLSDAAKGLVKNNNIEVIQSRSVAVQYLIQRNESRWLFDMLSRVNKDMKIVILRSLANSGNQEVFAELKKLLSKSDAEEAGSLVSILAIVDNDEVISLLISLLKDNRQSVRIAAINGLQNKSGCRYESPLSEKDGGEKDVIRAWQEWHDLFFAPISPDVMADVEVLRQALRDKKRKESTPLPMVTDTFSALLRLVGDKDLSSYALIELVKLNDKRAAATLIDLIDNPIFSRRSKEITDALLKVPSDKSQFDALGKLIKDSRTKKIAMQVMLAWRVPSSDLNQAILDQDNIPEEIRALLLLWKDCPVYTLARKVMVDDKAEERRRARALELIVILGDEQDIKALGKTVDEAGSSCRLAIQGLIRMASLGSENATREIARLLKDSIRQDPIRPPRVTRNKEPAQPPSTKPNWGLIIIEGLNSRPRDQQGERFPLSNPLPEIIAEWTTKADIESHQMLGLNLLLELKSKSAPAVLQKLLRSENEEFAKQVFLMPLQLNDPEARPLIDTLPNSPYFDESLVSKVTEWYRKVAKLSNIELRDLRIELLKKAEQQAESPVNDIVATFDLGGETSPLGSKDLTIKITLKNVGKTPYIFSPDMMQPSLHLRYSDDSMSTTPYNLKLNLPPLPKAKPGEAQINRRLTIAPGQTMNFTTLPFTGPREGTTVTNHKVRLVLGVRRSLNATGNERDGIFKTKYREHMFLPSLWDEIDRRHNKF